MLIFMDLDAGTSFTLNEMNLAIAETIIRLSLQMWMLNRKYNVTIFASNIDNYVTSEIVISKFATRLWL